jgi:CDGSH-type Zn-finger protein
MNDDVPPSDRPPRAKRVHPPGSITIRCRLDGPLVVELPPDAVQLGLRLRLTDHEGTELPLPAGDRPVALCRCGHSASKPFCDGSHKGNGNASQDTPPPACGT